MHILVNSTSISHCEPLGERKSGMLLSAFAEETKAPRGYMVSCLYDEVFFHCYLCPRTLFPFKITTTPLLSTLISQGKKIYMEAQYFEKYDTSEDFL